eukprot:TRINITY_DN41336_c0_g4_i1.p1 TRINITY_DN41336_c0_g4~~TRINITY_DN41336_c0_g4_i1.p1  ORF type:complete len:2108 (+),score=495.04 TRINITY_DN41336_c0_g4_i1:189-6512(+)
MQRLPGHDRLQMRRRYSSLPASSFCCRWPARWVGLLAAWLTFSGSLVEAFTGIVQADTKADFFINGVFMREDLSLPMLPLNSERRVESWANPMYPIEAANPFEPGDVIAVSVSTTQPRSVNVVEADYRVMEYPTFPAVIAAWEDGTMSSSEWRCTTENMDDWTLKDFDDSSWKPAVENNVTCCPWRDPRSLWKHLNAKWISADILHQNNTGQRYFYCRYTIPHDRSRLPVAETRTMQPADAPYVNITELSLTDSMAALTFSTNKQSDVYCGILDARYELRAPTPQELINWGEVKADVNPKEMRWFTNATGSRKGYSAIPAIQDGWHTVAVLEQCIELCEDSYADGGLCSAITYYEVGYSYAAEANGANCKLMDGGGLVPANLDAQDSNSQLMTHMVRLEATALHRMMISGMLLPGTVYNAYCTAITLPQASGLMVADAGEIGKSKCASSKVVFSKEGADASAAECQSACLADASCVAMSGKRDWEWCTGCSVPLAAFDQAYTWAFQKVNHSTWAMVKASWLQERTTGCVDCGELEPPSVFVLGGWADKNVIWVVVGSDSAGRLFCMGRPMDPEYGVLNFTTPTPDEVYDAHYVGFSVLAMGGGSVLVGLRDLPSNTLFEIFCMAESNGGATSLPAQVASSRHRWWTESEGVTIETMSISESLDAISNEKTVIMSARLNNIGYIWCLILNATNVSIDGAPRMATLREFGGQQKIADTRAAAAGRWRGLASNVTYEVFCTARYDDFANESQYGSQMASPYPSATILKGEVVLDSIDLQVMVDSGPARLTCKAIPWRRRPSSARPPVPIAADFDMPPYQRVDIENLDGATVEMKFEFLETGSYHDVYCYAEEAQDVPPGSVPPQKKEMPPEKIFATRTTFLTKGPTFQDSGWHCTAGRPCAITHVEGRDLMATDRVLVREDPCPGRCRCSGVEDEWHKGAECSSVYQGPMIAQPPPGYEVSVVEIDRMDERGPWCYVEPDSCTDAIPSNYTPYLVSWTACRYNMTAGRPNSGPPGFYREGVGLTDGDDGHAFYWNDYPLIAAGWGYKVCWCNSTAGPCAREEDYRLSIGVLHLSGPAEEQAQTTMSCVAGVPCTLEYFAGHALFDGSRLAVIPKTEQGCEWRKSSPFAYPGVEGFPQIGVSDPAMAGGRTYSWGASPVLSQGGEYALCWCGAVPQDAASHRRRTNGRDVLWKADHYECSDVRPDGGVGFLAPAGVLGVIGPQRYNTKCSIGVECVVENVPGYGLQGGDLMAILKSCGDEAVPPPGWWKKSEEDLEEGWQPGGWLQWGVQLADWMLRDLGAPTPSLFRDFNAGNLTKRAVWGFPNRGLSAGPSEGMATMPPGTYRWGAPTWAFSGQYKMCWCAASRGEPCFSPEQFRVEVGLLDVWGPAVLPLAAQVHRSVRGKRLEIIELQGTVPPASELMIARGECGTAAPRGIPRNGYSTPSQDGKYFSWQNDLITAVPGKYRICYCPNTGYCLNPEDYGAFAGILSVKGPLMEEAFWFCGQGQVCNITGIVGEGLHAGDKVKTMTVCGTEKAPDGFDNEGDSLATYNLGDKNDPNLIFEMPGMEYAGRFRVCYCPAETLCVRPQDYFVDLGQLEIGGPDPSQSYLCYEWRPCSITVVGTAFEEGDRLLALPDGHDCVRDARKPGVRGFPDDAISGIATDVTSGKATFSWGEDNVVATPGMYTLCYCNSRHAERVRPPTTSTTLPPDPDSNETNSTEEYVGCYPLDPFRIHAGSMRIAPYKEYMYLIRPADPPKRDNDQQLALLLALPLPLLFCMAICLGVKKLSARTSRIEAEAPPMFRIKKAWNALAQERSLTMDSIKQVLETRLAVAAQRTKPLKEIDDTVPNFIVEKDDPAARRARAKREREERERLEKERLEEEKRKAIEAGVLGGITKEQQQANAMAAIQSAQMAAALEFPDIPEYDPETAMALYDTDEWLPAKDSQGRTYYYNMASGRSLWKAPESEQHPQGTEAAMKYYSKVKPPKIKHIVKSFGTNPNTFRVLSGPAALPGLVQEPKPIRDRRWEEESEGSSYHRGSQAHRSRLRDAGDLESEGSRPQAWDEGQDFPDFGGREAPPPRGGGGGNGASGSSPPRSSSGRSGGSMHDRLDM